MKKVRWAVKMYRDWRNYRHANCFEFIECDLENKDTITKESLMFALVRFITKVKKVDGSDFPGNNNNNNNNNLFDRICTIFHQTFFFLL